VLRKINLIILNSRASRYRTIVVNTCGFTSDERTDDVTNPYSTCFTIPSNVTSNNVCGKFNVKHTVPSYRFLFSRTKRTFQYVAIYATDILLYDRAICNETTINCRHVRGAGDDHRDVRPTRLIVLERSDPAGVGGRSLATHIPCTLSRGNAN